MSFNIAKLKKKKQPLCPGNGNDKVYTPAELARQIIDRFQPSGRMCEPCRGSGSFSSLMPGCDWFELDDGRDFLTSIIAPRSYDWIITNPPFSLIYEFLEKSLEIAENIVFLAPINQTIGLKARRLLAERAGFALIRVVLVDTPPPPWPQSGFQLAAVHWRRLPKAAERGYLISWDTDSCRPPATESPRRQRKRELASESPFTLHNP